MVDGNSVNDYEMSNILGQLKMFGRNAYSTWKIYLACEVYCSQKKGLLTNCSYLFSKQVCRMYFVKAMKTDTIQYVPMYSLV